MKTAKNPSSAILLLVCCSIPIQNTSFLGVLFHLSAVKSKLEIDEV